MMKIWLALWEAWDQFLGQEKRLKKGMAAHSRILAWRIHGQSRLEDYSPWSSKHSDTTELLTLWSTMA